MSSRLPPRKRRSGSSGGPTNSAQRHAGAPRSQYRDTADRRESAKSLTASTPIRPSRSKTLAMHASHAAWRHAEWGPLPLHVCRAERLAELVREGPERGFPLCWSFSSAAASSLSSHMSPQRSASRVSGRRAAWAEATRQCQRSESGHCASPGRVACDPARCTAASASLARADQLRQSGRAPAGRRSQCAPCGCRLDARASGCRRPRDAGNRRLHGALRGSLVPGWAGRLDRPAGCAGPLGAAALHAACERSCSEPAWRLGKPD
mmetsp:Transcript_34929/g.111165  ORF Transcript_34929/g.111165 Transcript_34929/m.111165 type:complete len:264 (-) Transcript_34929:203-994(-)